MHCSTCQIDFNTLSAYVKHHRDLHSHSKNFCLVCSCGGSFSTLRSLQTHWCRFHNEKKGALDENIQLNEQEENNYESLSNQPHQEESSDLDFRVETDDQDNENLENESINSTNETESLSEEEQLKMFEKRVLYLLLTLQSVFYTSEAAINFVIGSLVELFLAIATKNLNINTLAACIDQFKSSHIRKKKATEYFQYIEPISQSYKATTKNKEIKTVKYSYVPFLLSLERYLRLPEVQADLHRAAPDYDPNCIQDIHHGDFARSHQHFQKSTYLEIELNSDDLTITNPISHRAHSIFFFYWSLLNVSREKRSKQAAKRLIAACPKWARKYNSLYHTVNDFLMGINTLSTTGITLNINGKDITYFGNLFVTLGDYPAQMSLNGFKESVSATHFCHLCDIQHDYLEEDISYDFPTITLAEYRERCTNLELVQDCPKSYENLSKKYGINNRSLFDELYDVTRQCPYDIMHTLLEGVLPNHLNVFLQFCVMEGYFRLGQFCSEVNNFSYAEGELNAKPHLNLTLDELKKQNNMGMPLTSMQTFNLFVNLPFILKKLLQSSDFPQYHALLICVDILSLCFATTITYDTHQQLSHFIKIHNSLFKKFYPGKMKFKFHFMTHFPYMMKNLGPLAYTSCLATERKHQFFKGNKVRNLKHPSLMLARRHEMWVCVNDHSQDGSLSHNALSDIPCARLDDRQPINDGQIQFLISNMFNLPFKPRSTLKTLIINGQKYSHNSILNASREYFPSLPTVGKIRWILYDGRKCAFICTIYKMEGYVQNLRAFHVTEINKLECFLLEDICYKKTLKLVSLNGSLYLPLHPYGKSFTVL